MLAARDFPSTIAAKFKVRFEDLLAINGWTLAGDQVPEFPVVGTLIRIPPGWTEPGTGSDSTRPSRGMPRRQPNRQSRSAEVDRPAVDLGLAR